MLETPALSSGFVFPLLIVVVAVIVAVLVMLDGVIPTILMFVAVGLGVGVGVGVDKVEPHREPDYTRGVTNLAEYRRATTLRA